MQNESEFKEINVKIRRGLFDRRERNLFIGPSCVQFESNDLRKDAIVTIDRNEIKAFRYGIKWIKGAEFTIGREFQIYILNNENKTLKINFSSYYGIKKAELNKLYSDIIQALWTFYFDDITMEFLDLFHSGNTIEIGSVQISQEGILINTGGIISVKKTHVVWDNVGTHDYATYFAIYAKNDPSKINSAHYYLKDWNTAVLYSVIRTILRDKKLL